MIRTMRSAPEEKRGVKLDVEHRVWPWLVEYAAYLLTRAEVGADGKSAYERSRGKVSKLTGVEFGEGVLWKRRRWAARKVDVHVGRRNIPWSEREHWRDDSGRRERRVENEEDRAGRTWRRLEECHGG